MRPAIVIVVLFTFTSVLLSCGPSDEHTGQKQQTIYSLPSSTVRDSLPDLSPEQSSAFEALNKLQVRTDRKNHLYSTLPNMNQPCYPPDNNFTLTRSELKTAMENFVAKHCTELAPELQNELASKAVMAADSYKIIYCSDGSTKAGHLNGIPLSGTWVLSNVLDRRDVVMVW